ncbi:MAG: hypothetical protein HYU73_05585, partial [Betaproteobacteria bacterium]|nr:hypothetical protein [Betaproteobacteria bacterium]
MRDEIGSIIAVCERPLHDASNSLALLESIQTKRRESGMIAGCWSIERCPDILERHAAYFLKGLIMSMTLRDALARFTVPELKDLVSYLPGAETAGRKDEVIERIVAGMLGPGLEAIWSGLDETQQAAVAEAVHHPLGEYSEQRFRAKYQRVP